MLTGLVLFLSIFAYFGQNRNPPSWENRLLRHASDPWKPPEIGLKTYQERATAGWVGAFFSRRMYQISSSRALVAPRTRQTLFRGASATPRMDHHALRVAMF